MVSHRVWAALALVAVVLVGRVDVAVANANAIWNTAFNDPSRVDVSDISSLSTKTVLYTDPMADVLRALVMPQYPSRVVVVAPSASDQVSPRAHRPRAPPAV